MESIERRLAALERQAEEQEERRKALRAQLIALQLVFGRLVPVISAASAVELDAAIAAAKATALTLQSLGFEEDEVRAVAEGIDALQDDLLGEAAPASWH